MRKTTQFLVGILVVIFSLGVILFIVSTTGLSWRIERLLAEINYALNPPEKVVFVPVGQTLTPLPVERPLSVTQLPLPSATPTIALVTATPTTPPPPTLLPSVPTQVPTPLPAQVTLTGIQHMFQMWNNCGPANLAMALSYWGWKGDQRAPAAVLKPNGRDKNVMPYEMESYVEQQAGLDAVVRTGGDLDTLKAFIAAGFPVLVEKGFEGVGFDGWMGHYQVVSGYDDAAGQFIVQDSYKGPDLPSPYDQFVSDWRAFNYTYMVVYPVERRQQVLAILGLQAYDNYNNRAAAQKADAEVTQLTGRDLFFALFNQGTNLVAEQDYARAAAAYDAAFANYAQIPEASRPWRMMWYQTGPYFAYYYTGRYQDVINLATQTLDAMNEPILEESFYWRARAYLAMADADSAVKDLKQCLVVHPGFDPCIQELLKMGIEPPPTPAIKP
jgi:hypothetical protein